MHQTGGIGAVRNGFSTKDVRIQPGTVHSDRWAMMRRDGSEPSVSTTRITVKPAGSSDRLGLAWLQAPFGSTGIPSDIDGPPPCLPRHYTARRHSLASLAKSGRMPE